MADNIAITPGTGKTIATDDLSNVHHPLVKIEYGTDGNATMVSATNPLPVSLTDLEFAEDSAHTSTDKGVMALGVRNDVLAALGGADGDYSPLQVDALGALFTTGPYQEDAAHTSTDYGQFVLAVRNDTLAALGGTDGDYAPFQVDANGALFVKSAGIELAEDAAHQSGDLGVMALAVRNDTLAALAGTDGDYTPLQVDASGALFIHGTVAEDTTAGAGDSGFPALAVRNDDLAALAGADGDYANLQVDANGALYVNNIGDANPATSYTASVTATGGTDAGANKILSVIATNFDTVTQYLKIYDKATAADENDTPVLKLSIPSKAEPTVVTLPVGLPISNGISMRATEEHVDSGTTGAGANEVAVTLILED